MLSFIRRWSSNEATLSSSPDPMAHPALPAAPLPKALYVVGDVHGCLSHLQTLEQMIKTDAGPDFPTATIVYVGDIVDRGPDSASVLDRLSFRTSSGPRRIVLLGNHEQMMQKFLTTPTAKSRWLDFGGTETLASYGIHADPHKGWGYSAKNWRYLIDANVPSQHTDFLHGLPRSVQFGRYFISHAGINATKPLSEQSLTDLVWTTDTAGRPIDDVTLVHGHTVVSQPELAPHRINVDTGAYATGRLTAVCLAPDQAPRVLQT